MYEQIASNKRRSALLIAGFALLVALVFLAVNFLISGGAIGFVIAAVIAIGVSVASYYNSDKVAYARQFYNDSVLTYNTKIQQFPTVILAGMFNFDKRDFFDAEPGDTEPVQVQF